MSRRPKLSEGFKKCLAVVKHLSNHKWGWPFVEPVDPKKLGIPDYFDIIKKPMDLATIKKKLDDHLYETVEVFAEDVRQVWKNAMLYNQPGSDVYVMAEALSDLFNKKFEEIQATVRAEQQQATEATAVASSASKPKVKKPPPGFENAVEMTFEEKHTLAANMNKLSSKKLGKVVQIIHDRNSDLLAQQSDPEEIEIDIDALDKVTLRMLEKFVESCIKKKDEKKRSKDSNGVKKARLA